MSVGRVSDYAVALVRKSAERQMVDTIEIYRPGAPTFDNNTGLMTAHKTSVIYTGKARIWVGTSSPIAQGDGVIMFDQVQISIPFNSVMPRRDDMIKIVAAGQSATVGDTYRIIGTTTAGDLGAVITLTCTTEEGSSFTA